MYTLAQQPMDAETTTATALATIARAARKGATVDLGRVRGERYSDMLAMPGAFEYVCNNLRMVVATVEGVRFQGAVFVR